MRRSILVCVTAVALAGSAWAQDKEQKPAAAPAQGQGPAMDMTKVGPMARKPTNESQTKKEVQDFFKKQDENHKKGDLELPPSAIQRPARRAVFDARLIPTQL